MKNKTIKITQTKTEDGEETNFEVSGFSNWEVMGLLSYYNDAYKVAQMRINDSQKKDSLKNENHISQQKLF